MYTGTLIDDLLAAVERAELGAQRKRLRDEIELRRMFELDPTRIQSETILAGAA